MQCLKLQAAHFLKKECNYSFVVQQFCCVLRRMLLQDPSSYRVLLHAERTEHLLARKP
jgi:hypothetical protein